jgi:hypothetical protein
MRGLASQQRLNQNHPSETGLGFGPQLMTQGMNLSHIQLPFGGLGIKSDLQNIQNTWNNFIDSNLNLNQELPAGDIEPRNEAKQLNYDFGSILDRTK